MYDRRLEGIVAAAESGSFSKAAAQLCVSTTALAKQVSSFEAEHGLTLFVRTRQGVRATEAGAALVEDARLLMRQASDALRRAHALSGDETCIQLGVSMLCPGRKVLDLWPEVHALDPGLRLELTPIGDIYDERLDIMACLGTEGYADVVQTSYSSARWDGLCRTLAIGSAPLAVDVAQGNPLARRSSVGIEDLRGRRVRVLRHGNDAMDALRPELSAAGAEVVDVDGYDLALFNGIAESDDCLVTAGAWSGVHPSLVTIPLVPERRCECVLVYAREPSAQVVRLVDALAQALARRAERP